MAKFELDTEFVRKLAQILHETQLGEIELADGERRIRVARPTVTVAPAAAVVAGALSTAPVGAAGSAAATSDAARHPGAVNSPIVGTAYLAPEPGKPNFVAVGDKVTAGQTLLIIEAMKTFNPIKAPKAGTVVRILVENAQPVEYGEPLMIVNRTSSMFEKVLIANRGEIALRIHRACREMGIQTVAVHSTADSDAMHVRLADESVCIGPPPARDSYLNIPAILSAATIAGVDAIHPGYGFLSEDARFAEAVEAHGFVFIGPTPQHIRIMGDKIVAKQTARELGLPLVPGSPGPVVSLDDIVALGNKIGWPVLIKAVAGGGGRGMKVVEKPEQSAEAFTLARAEAKAAFGNDAVYLEKYLGHPRHIEIQVLGDGKGAGIHLGERDCSLQRRHQKVLEEAPSPALNAEQREKIGEMAAAAIRKLQYRGVGTMEFLFQDGEFYFIEMNTRLQVEHPITEAVTGIDLVREQIRIADGAPLGLAQEDVVIQGHAIECRIDAEHPETFAPSPGRIVDYHPPGGLGVRVDSGLYTGYVMPPYYDSMVAKLIVNGATRNECLMRLRRSLEEFVIGGIETTIPLHQRIIGEPSFIDGDYDIHWLERLVGLKK